MFRIKASSKTSCEKNLCSNLFVFNRLNSFSTGPMWMGKGSNYMNPELRQRSNCRNPQVWQGSSGRTSQLMDHQLKRVFIPLLFMDHQLNKSYLYACMLIISSYISSSWDPIIYCIESRIYSKFFLNIEKGFRYKF